MIDTVAVCKRQITVEHPCTVHVACVRLVGLREGFADLCRARGRIIQASKEVQK